MASIEETLNRLREDNLKSIEDERIARERETSARLNLLQDEKSLLAKKKLNARFYILAKKTIIKNIVT